MKKVVLIGASGFVGSAILNEALNRGFHVTAVVRHPEKIKIENENLEVKRADVSSLDEVCKVCKGADAVISAFNPGWNNPDIYKETIGLSDDYRWCKKGWSLSFFDGGWCRFTVYCSRHPTGRFGRSSRKDIAWCESLE